MASDFAIILPEISVENLYIQELIEKIDSIENDEEGKEKRIGKFN
ncbi:MAG: hypothetical protein CM15mP45_22630 [Deltaproteobacteria bacterium]|nr:MAG: hypothetical protein CM15mP45_22630 [Deltaproteobacteria bacterium]